MAAETIVMGVCLIVMAVAVIIQAFAMRSLSEENSFLRETVAKLGCDCAEMQERMRIMEAVRKEMNR